MAKFVGVERACEACGVIFKSPQSHKHVRTCSRACGYKIRNHPNKKEKVELACPQCGKLFSERPCHAGRRTYCSKECQYSDPAFLLQLSAKTTGENNPNWIGGKTKFSVSASGRRYGRVPQDVERAKTANRRSRKLEATPIWADGEAILKIYADATRLSIETGIAHHVDHIVPLTSKYVCGLHCEFNLQVLMWKDNLKKHNRTWPNQP